MKFAYNAKEKPQVIWYDFLEPGIVAYDNGETVPLLRKETIDAYLRSFIGLPLILDNHVTGLTPEQYERVAHGWAVDVRYNEYKGKYQVGILPISDEAQIKVAEDEGRKYGISCAYNILESAGGGKWHNIPYTEEYLKIDGTHFALVENPRYEDSYRTDVYIPKENAPIRMMVNSKDATIQPNKPIEGGSGMFKFLFNKDKVTKDKDGKEIFNAGDGLEIDGEKVTEEELISAYRMSKKMKANADDEAAKKKEAEEKERKEKENAASDEEKAKKEKEEKEAKDKADQEAKNAAEAEEKKKKEEDEKLKIERQNAADAEAKRLKDQEGKEGFERLNGLREEGELLVVAGTKVMVSTFADKVELGKQVA